MAVVRAAAMQARYRSKARAGGGSGRAAAGARGAGAAVRFFGKSNGMMRVASHREKRMEALASSPSCR